MCFSYGFSIDWTLAMKTFLFISLLFLTLANAKPEADAKPEPEAEAAPTLDENDLTACGPPRILSRWRNITGIVGEKAVLRCPLDTR